MCLMLLPSMCTCMPSSHFIDAPASSLSLSSYFLQGTVLTHANLVAIVASRKLVFNSLVCPSSEKDAYISYLPLSHIYDR